MGAIAPLVVAIFVIGVISRALVTGNTMSGDSGFDREEEPALFWTTMAAGCAIAVWLLYVAWRK